MNIIEIFKIAFSSIKANKLRSILTLVGVIVGIFSIISTSTLISILESSIESGFSQLGKNTFQIQKFPNIQTGPGSRDKFRNRADITYDEYVRLKDLLTVAEYVGAEMWNFGGLVQFKNEKTNPNVQVAGISPEAQPNNQWNIEKGRAINNNDVKYSNKVAVLGKDVAKMLFKYTDPVGQNVRIDGQLFNVIGVYEKQGELFGSSRDNFVTVPITTHQNIYGKYRRSLNITVTAKSKELYNETIESTIGYMRTIRKVKPGEENDFEIWSNESMLSQIGNYTQYVSMGAFFVAAIALLAAGVGIMNIMLVSVTERTREIGIRKAIGAKKKNILMQFLTEAVVLCLTGGIIGIILGVFVGILIGSMIYAKIIIPFFSVFLGITLCVLTGVIFGTYPAYKAANLDPIEALRYE